MRRCNARAFALSTLPLHVISLFQTEAIKAEFRLGDICWLCHNVSNHLICIAAMKFHYSLRDLILDKVTFSVDMLCVFLERWILD